jgi:RND family efflux transporter MFP subunit
MHSMFTGHRQSWLLLLALATAPQAACQRQQPQEAASPETAPVLIGPENIVIVRKDSISSGPRLSGSLEPRRQARVLAEISGSVTSVQTEIGNLVKKGQVLARIEDAALRNAYQSAKSALTSAELEYQNARRQAERTEKLVEGGALATRDLEMAQSNRSAAQARAAQARAQLAQARQQLDAATVTSPMNGSISEKSVNQGDVVTVGAPLFTVIDPSSMRLEASVSSDAIPVLQLGTPVMFQVRGYPNQSFTGKIAQVAPAADPATRQITTLVDIPNPGGKLIAGLFAEGRIGAETRETLVVPISAINSPEENPYVIVIRNGRAERVAIKLGLRDPQTERVEIQGPIQEDEVLLSGTTRSLAPGTRVKLTGTNPEANRG